MQRIVVPFMVMCLVAGAFLVGAAEARAWEQTVPLPVIQGKTVTPRIVYVENPRFPRVAPEELMAIVRAAAALVREHFGIKVVLPASIPKRGIQEVFDGLVGNEPEGLPSLIGDFRHGKVDWQRVEANLLEQIRSQQEPLEAQIAFARPYLTAPLDAEDAASLAHAVSATFAKRLAYWTEATLEDGYPVIGEAVGLADLPYNEYGYWTLMAKLGVEAEIVLTNQLVASVEYIPVPVHTSIRGGITGGSTEFNPASRYGASVWVSLFPFYSSDPQITMLRKDRTYTREEAVGYAGAMLAHEMGHQLLHLEHPWSNPACLMRPAEMLDAATWVTRFDAARCPVGSSPAMTPGALEIPVW